MDAQLHYSRITGLILNRLRQRPRKLHVFLGGRSTQLEKLVSENSYLQSEFKRTLCFPNYSDIELCEIFERYCNSDSMAIASEFRAMLMVYIHVALKAAGDDFENADFVRALYEQCKARLTNRLSEQNSSAESTRPTLAADDIDLGPVDMYSGTEWTGNVLLGEWTVQDVIAESMQA